MNHKKSFLFSTENSGNVPEKTLVKSRMLPTNAQRPGRNQAIRDVRRLLNHPFGT